MSVLVSWNFEMSLLQTLRTKLQTCKSDECYHLGSIHYWHYANMFTHLAQGSHPRGIWAHLWQASYIQILSFALWSLFLQHSAGKSIAQSVRGYPLAQCMHSITTNSGTPSHQIIKGDLPLWFSWDTHIHSQSLMLTILSWVFPWVQGSWY